MDEANLARSLTPDLIRRMVAGFYRRVRTDTLIGPMYPEDDWAGAEERLGNFLLFRFLGDPTYMNERGHPRLRMRHAPFSIGVAERDRWMQLMAASLDELTELPQADKAAITTFFFQVADHMRNRMEPTTPSPEAEHPNPV